MTDPTLVTNVTPYDGFTLDSITERLLATRGMTLDSDTGRTVATTTEQTEAYERVRRAFALMNTKYPSLMSVHLYSVAWTAGDTMLALPAAVQSIVYANYNGNPLKPLTRTKYQALSGSDDSGAPFVISGKPYFYFLAGISDEGVAPATDYRYVFELVPHPDSTFDTKTLEIAYNSKAPALPRTSANEGAVTLPVHEAMQEWLLRRAQMLWATDQGNIVNGEIAKEALGMVEQDIDEWIEGNTEYPQVAEAEYPILPEYNRDR